MGVVVESQAVGNRMNYFALWLVFPLFAIGEGLMDSRTRMSRPHVDTYWESWEEGKGDFASNLIDVAVSPIGSPYGVNVINIAFALPNATRDDYTCRSDPTCITAGYYGNKTLLHQAVKRIHEHGGLVKLAIGGDAYGNPGEGLLRSDVDNFVWRITQVVKGVPLGWGRPDTSERLWLMVRLWPGGHSAGHHRATEEGAPLQDSLLHIPLGRKQPAPQTSHQQGPSISRLHNWIQGVSISHGRNQAAWSSNIKDCMGHPDRPGLLYEQSYGGSTLCQIRILWRCDDLVYQQ